MSTEALVTVGLEDNEDSPPPAKKMGSKRTIIIVLVVGVLAMVIGLSVAILWMLIYNNILLQELVLSPTSTSYSLWKETPIPMYLKIHLFHWTNPEDFYASSAIKPNFVEMGPYVFKEVDYKVHKVWNNENGTITFQQKKVWQFQESMSNGLLSDNVTNLNPVLTTIAHMIRYETVPMKFILYVALNQTNETLTVTKTVQQLLFDGYNDTILSLASKFNIPEIPFDKFGWFYTRNDSDSYDGTFNMNTGINDINELGSINEWNYSNRSKYYKGTCGTIGGTLGDLWPPVKGKKKVSAFVPDACTSMSLDYNGPKEYLGVIGNEYVSTENMLDNGTLVESRKCYCEGDIECQPSGVFNVSQCKFGAPAFMSLPHFYLADESYRSAITGMEPDKAKHQFSLVVEPTAGIPMQVRAKMQLNLLVQPDPKITVLKNVPRTFIPMLWFEQEANLSPSLASQIKFVLILPMLGHVSFYGLAAIGLLLVFIAVGLSIRRYRQSEENQNLISRAATIGSDG